MRYNSPQVRVGLALLCQSRKQNRQCCDEERDGNPKQNFGYVFNHRAMPPYLIGVRIAENVQLRCDPSTNTDRKPTKLEGKLSCPSYRTMSELFHLQLRMSHSHVGDVGRRTISLELSREVTA
jgi:hypothetical protein